MHVRPYQSGDLPHLSEICRRTGDHGNDASATCSHPELLGDYYAVPYAEREPELCRVLVGESGPCGYILGTADTRTFAAWFNERWLPAIRCKYRDVAPAPDASDTWLLDLLTVDAEVPECVDDYPAHLHIDLLPQAQGAGWGRELLQSWLDLAAAKGAWGVHLGVSKRNLRAVAFYERLGFLRLHDSGGAWLYGRKLSRQP